MKRRDKQPPSADELRRQAEALARKKEARSPEPPKSLSPDETRQALHELRVHQIELEMQNEELRRTQADLEALRTHYFDLYDLAPVGYVTLSEEGLVLEANLAAATLLGTVRTALVKRPFSRFILKEDQDIYYLHSRQVLGTGKRQTCELRLARTDGAVVWVHLEEGPAQDDGSAPMHRVAMIDISGRKRGEDALERVRAEAENERLRLNSVLEVLPTGVAITDAAGGTVQSNTEFERIWGGPRPAARCAEDYAAFRGWWADTGEAVKPGEWASARAMQDRRAVLGQILEIERFDGARAFVINSASPIYNADGSLIGSAVAIHDITDLRNAEQRIQALNSALEKHAATVEAVNRELESYSHSVSHDLRTPLRFVNRIAHVLLHEPGAQLSKNAAEQVNMILQATGEMAQMIEKLLVFSQASHVALKKRRMDLRRLFQDVVTELQHAQEGFVVEVVIENLAPCQGDRTLLKEVVANLLTNALKFTRRRESARITVGCTQTGAETVYFVRDNGVGFDMSDTDLLFVPFNRLRKSGDFEGTGIGLALVKRIIERHDGRIWAEGEIDKGATFYFTLGNEPVK